MDSRGANVEWKRPLERTGLFQVFAALDPTEDAIVRFADRFGLLRQVPGTEPAGMEPFAETIESWRVEIAAMADAVEVWRLLRDDDRSSLSKFIRWERAGVVLFGRDEKNAVAMPVGLRASRTPRFEPGDTIEPARFFLAEEISRRLRGVSPFVREGSDSEHFESGFRPEHLLAAMWLQFARAVVGRKDYRPCDYCREPFEIRFASGGKRSHARFCSRACKSAEDYQQRKAKRHASKRSNKPRKRGSR